MHLLLLYGFSRERWWWRVMYLSLVALFLILSAELLQHLSGFSSPFPSTFERPTLYLATALLFFIVICDFRIGVKRDWIHFAGIAIFLLFNVGSILFYMILFRYVPPGDLFGRGWNSSRDSFFQLNPYEWKFLIHRRFFDSPIFSWFHICTSFLAGAYRIKKCFESIKERGSRSGLLVPPTQVRWHFLTKSCFVFNSATSFKVEAWKERLPCRGFVSQLAMNDKAGVHFGIANCPSRSFHAFSRHKKVPKKLNTSKSFWSSCVFHVLPTLAWSSSRSVGWVSAMIFLLIDSVGSITCLPRRCPASWSVAGWGIQRYREALITASGKAGHSGLPSRQWIIWIDSGHVVKVGQNGSDQDWLDCQISIKSGHLPAIQKPRISTFYGVLINEMSLWDKTGVT